MDITLMGIDIAKEVFQLCGIDDRGKVIVKKRLTRKQRVPYIAHWSHKTGKVCGW